MFTEFIDDIKKYCISQYPNEAIVAVFEDHIEYIENIHSDPENNFKIDPGTFVDIESRDVKAILHSHPDAKLFPTKSDMVAQISCSIPFGIIVNDDTDATDPIWFGDGLPKAPLIGRGFIYGVYDCYTAVRDYYYHADLHLPEFPREWDWWHKDENMYLDNFKKAGFKEIEAADLKIGDAMLFSIRSKVPNHAAVYIGDNMMFHHLGSQSPVDLARLSRREPITRWTNLVTHWLRNDEFKAENFSYTW
jgi:proteasome lid subunit RPN8/RPN11